MNNDLWAFVLLVLGVAATATMGRAAVTGHNSLARLAPLRSEKPKAFWFELALLAVLGVAMIRLGAQLLGWI